MTLRRTLLSILSVIALLAGAAIYWLFYDNRMPADGNYPLDIAAIRAEADRMPGSKPVAIQVETVSHSKVPEIAMAAGTSWQRIDGSQRLSRGVCRPLGHDRHRV